MYLDTTPDQIPSTPSTDEPPPETREDAVLRLAAKARAEGVTLYRDPKDGRHYASSVSHPGTLHYVTGVSCDCPGFASHQRCKHHSALLVALGWVTDPDDPEPEPAIIALPVPEPLPVFPCDLCRGTGSVHGTIPVSATAWRYADITCPTCHGKGEVRCPECMDTGIAEAWSAFTGQTTTPCQCEAGQRLTVRDLAIVHRETGQRVFLDAVRDDEDAA